MSNMPTRLTESRPNGAVARRAGQSLRAETLQLRREEDTQGLDGLELKSEEEDGMGKKEDKKKYPPCVRCDHKGMVCQFLVASGREKVNTTCVRCVRAGEKYCIKQTMIGPERDPESRLVYVDKDTVVDDVQEFEDLAAQYVGEGQVQAQPGVWVYESEAKNFALPNYRSYKQLQPLRTLQDVLAHDANVYGRVGSDWDCYEEQDQEY